MACTQLYRLHRVNYYHFNTARCCSINVQCRGGGGRINQKHRSMELYEQTIRLDAYFIRGYLGVYSTVA